MAEKIKINFLGTGSAIPTKEHNHPAILISYKDENILVDCGEGTQRQFRKADLNPCKLTRILITHWHGDHVLGLPGLFQTLMLNGYNKTLRIYGPRGTKKMVEYYMNLFVNVGKIKIEAFEANKTVIDEKDFFIEADEMNHGTPDLAYSFNIKEKTRLDKNKLKKLKLPNGPLIAELQKGKTINLDGKKIDGKKLIYKEESKKITIIMDTLLNENCYKIAKDSNLLICESTYTSEEKELAKEHLHLTSEQSAQIAKKSNSKKLILTHLSQRYSRNHETILKEAKKIFKNTFVAQDFDKLEI
ncbi:MAG: ribonuclease Z [Nanoarchaeota archaeon]|nr:ribonuclease Z [Nanoarchaeota archaeon]